ncbi:MAG: hypothetical protein H7A37_00570 [Chlamydiales bacterium]|nr:hypothetical protein [Chlamydiales bacterium]
MNTTYDLICSICQEPPSIPVKIGECGHVFDLSCLGKWVLLNNREFNCPLDRKKINIAKISYERTKDPNRDYTEILINHIFQPYGFTISVPVDVTFSHLDGLLYCSTNFHLLEGEDEKPDLLDHQIRNIFVEKAFRRSINSPSSLSDVKLVLHHPGYCEGHAHVILKGSEIADKTVGELGFVKDEKHALYWSRK